MLDSDVILSHTLVPKHEIMKKKEVDEFFKGMGITKERMPKINSADPVVKAIGAKKGDVLKITRHSLTAGEAVSYRIVH